MKYLLPFGIAACLLCSAFAFAQNRATSTEAKQEPAAADSNAQQPKQPHETTAGFGGIDILTEWWSIGSLRRSGFEGEYDYGL
jgi:hypothetical protein